jgi:hypothetical protein
MNCNDIIVFDCSGRTRFPQKAVFRPWFASFRRLHHLQGHAAAQMFVFGQEYKPHSALTKDF